MLMLYAAAMIWYMLLHVCIIKVNNAIYSHKYVKIELRCYKWRGREIYMMWVEYTGGIWNEDIIE